MSLETWFTYVAAVMLLPGQRLQFETNKFTMRQYTSKVLLSCFEITWHWEFYSRLEFYGGF